MSARSAQQYQSARSAPSYQPDAALTFKEAAEAAGCSVDTIKRRHQGGTFPHVFQDAGDKRGTWLIPVTDLVAAGLLGADALVDVAETVATVKHGREAAAVQTALESARQDLALQVAALRAQVTGLEAQLARVVDERDFLRGLVTATTGGAGIGAGTEVGTGAGTGAGPGSGTGSGAVSGTGA
ncbi:hypothetical protein [Nocardioides sp. CER19]|uniref:hypothetical protein n=1 Tax=Nocardioides sp. CER19 TaxID=3038538 RepID=UPI00244B461D|nr:hypothetical protein [Nocardioides sp. CER19]MDH2415291.1 hypothetical protein [Nocardioides sp. CER19]